MARGVVRFWNAEKGWGAISSDELPPGRDAWAHYSHIMDMPGYRALEAGQAVEFSFEAAQQDGFDFRVIEVRLANLNPMTTRRAPVAFEVYQPGVYLHGTKADLAIGELLVPGRESNFEQGRVMNYIYFTATLDAATWGAELAAGDGRGRIYIVEPIGGFEDDPNVTDKRFPGNPTQSFRSLEPIRAVGELLDWVGHPAAALNAMRESVAVALARGTSAIED